ncbi:c-type cytochrome [Taibaiella lutea]|uniref:C-type cytochrome n=1 Tax=Taibaiella lutea TaxID=2608001 RepID=A0A5M6CN02_9BACT|nr:cytochrome c peroxidase [Taibaiella lutea]KAA5536514.1 c-type cytochrome [Taibaiella lutea]
MNKIKITGILALLMLTIVTINACKKDPVEEPDEPYTLDIGTFPTPNLPADNPLTREGVKLGRMLFYEKKLSGTNTQSCSSCHMQQFAFSDTAALSIGVRGMHGKRQAMSVSNMAWNSNEFFWDGRAHLLRDQSLKPIQDALEMDETLDNVVAKLQADETYRNQFRKAFGTETITSELMSKAMEQFMLTIVSKSSKFDDYKAGKATLTPEEERGRFLFFTEYNPGFPAQSGADCQHCHGGANFENDAFMNNGLDADADFIDIGREGVTGLASDRARFKVPSLRNVAITAPYMHDGRFKTLEQVVGHYNLVRNSSTLDPSFQQQLPNGLQLSPQDRAALVAFLKTLTDKDLTTNPVYSSPF